MIVVIDSSFDCLSSFMGPMNPFCILTHVFLSLLFFFSIFSCSSLFPFFFSLFLLRGFGRSSRVLFVFFPVSRANTRQVLFFFLFSFWFALFCFS